MCGIAGAIAPINSRIDRGRLGMMTNAIAHRGPDGAGYWVSPNGRAGLGHRRLSIIDLSPTGAQPMSSSSGRYTVSFNGEIYNFATLRGELVSLGASFRGCSDTEVILAACDIWGIPYTLSRLAGMFALAIWDEVKQALCLARDRIGIKPLFYSVVDGELIFASELRPLIIWRGKFPSISVPGLTEFLRFAYVPGPASIFEGISKLLPGTFVTFCAGVLSEPQPYWRFVDAVLAGVENAFDDEAEAMDALDRQLRDAVASHMVSDVPLGAFLSGGIDSSIVVALMQAQSSRPVKTFSIGFSEVSHNEAVYAKGVAAYLGTEHTELYVADADLRAVIPLLPDIYDEPFADTSQIPTFLLAQLARKCVTVALTGDGGDELFGGYNRYLFVSEFWNRLQKLPVEIRKLAASTLAGVTPQAWDGAFHAFGPLLPRRLRPSLPGQKMHKIAAVLRSASLQELHTRLISQWPNPQCVLHADFRCKSVLPSRDFLMGMPSMTAPAQQMAWDAQAYLVDDILTKVDRATMRVGLEARVPFLDHRVVEFAWRLPLAMKIRNGVGKRLLKELLYEYVPKEILERPKMGFGVPIDEWLRGPLREWAEAYLSSDRLCAAGLFDVNIVRQTWAAHISGSVNRGGQLWVILMFQSWQERMRRWL